jgi:PAS domain S-box-containing protein
MGLLDRHSVILSEIAFAAAAMARSHDWRDGIDELLARLGRAVDVSRVYLFEVEQTADGRLAHTCRHDWAAPGLDRLANAPRYTQERLEDYDPVIDDWIVRRRRGEMIQGHTRDLTGPLREDFDYQQIKSYLSIPIHVDGSWWGHLGFDDCVRERNWGSNELHLLQTTAALIHASVVRQNTAEQLRRNDALRAAMLDVALDCIVMMDERGRILEFNPAAVATFGWRRDEVIGRNVGELLVPERLREAHDLGFREATAARSMRFAGQRAEFTALRRDGAEFPIELTVTQINRGPELVYAAFIRDLTDRNAAEARLRAIERERTNLARFFSPKLIEQIIAIDTPLSVARLQPASVMFVDMVGFTGFCSRTDPDAVIETLRGLLALLSQAVFAHQGTIDKFLGDGLMAVFGAPIPGPMDATDAALCALQIVEGIDTWNAARAGRGEDPIRIAIGINHGEVVLGDVGSNEKLELTVVGDTVNIARRVEGFCRSLESPLLVTGSFIEELRAEGGGHIADRFVDRGHHILRGRPGASHLFALDRSTAG